ncbi:MAG: glutaredoxin family protein [Spirochaetaceae bacterium]|nr:MAG: glutaredoxin family protein [Spirochaetaceae bacterium]
MAIKATVYSSPICPQCQRAKQFLASQGVEYDEVDVSADPEVARMLKEKTGVKLVPVVELQGEFYPGFIRSKLEKVLAEIQAGDGQ